MVFLIPVTADLLAGSIEENRRKKLQTNKYSYHIKYEDCLKYCNCVRPFAVASGGHVFKVGNKHTLKITFVLKVKCYFVLNKMDIMCTHYILGVLGDPGIWNSF